MFDVDSLNVATLKSTVARSISLIFQLFEVEFKEKQTESVFR